MKKRGKIRYIFSFVSLAVLLAVLIFWNINAGSVSVSIGDVFRILFQREGDETARNIIWSIRLPRILAALILGGALSVSGFLLQTFFNNPIAGPFVLGISSGAKLTVALTMIFLLGKGLTAGSAVMILAAFVGSLISMGFRASGIQKSAEYVHAGDLRRHDRLYLLCGNGFCSDVCG